MRIDVRTEMVCGSMTSAVEIQWTQKESSSMVCCTPQEAIPHQGVHV